ncbi:hypothetical protein CVT25_007936, partial [Psilocybe cyanescens]
LPSAEFTRIVRDLSRLSESVRIEVSKEGVRFASDGEAANGSVLLRQSDGGHVSGGTIKPKVEEGTEGSGEADEETMEEDDDEEGGEAKSPAEDEGDNSIPAGVVIEMNQHVSLTFSLKYLVNFSKSASLSGEVQLLMRNDVPLLVAYDFTQGYILYYLAPKIGDD